MKKKPKTQITRKPALWVDVILLFLLVAAFFWPWWLNGPGLLEDALLYGWPTRSIILEHLSSFQLPLWDPYSYGGDAWIGSPIYGIFYLPQILLFPYFWLGATQLSVNAYSAWLFGHFLVAALGGWILARKLGMTRLTCLWLGMGYALSQIVIERIRHGCYLIPLVWMPWLAWLTIRMVERPSLRRAAVLGLVTGAVLVATTPQYFFYVGGMILILGLSQPLSGGVGRRQVWPMLGIAGLIALGIMAAPLLYQVEYAAFCGRITQEFTSVEDTASPWWVPIRAFFPYVTGMFLQADWIGWGDTRQFPFIHFLEEAIYPGLVVWFGVFLLIASGAWKEAKMRPWLLLILAGLVYSLFEFNPVRVALRAILFPIATARHPIRGWCWVQMGLMVIAAFGYARYFAGQIPKRSTIYAWLGLIAIWLAGVGYSLYSRKWAPVDPSWVANAAVLLRDGMLVQIVCLGSAGFLFIGMRKLSMKRHKIIEGILIVILLFELSFFGSHLVEGSRKETAMYEVPEELGQVKSLLDECLFRMDGHPIMDITFIGARTAIPMLQGYNTLRLPNTGEMFIRPVKDPEKVNVERRLDLYGVAFAFQVDQEGYVLAPRENPFPKVWFCPQVEFASEEQILEKIDSESINLRQKVILREKDRARATEVISKHVVPVGEFTPAEITIVEYKPNEVKLDVRTQFPGWLVINDHYLPGWGCDVDGREVPIFQANGIFRAVYLPSGHHQVRYWFWPQRLSLGLTIAAVSLVFGVYGLTRRDSKSIVTTKAEKGRQKVSV
jgi:hypothetical protein